MLLIGSQALKHHNLELLLHPPKDWDLVCTWEEFETWSKGKKFHRLEPANQGKKMIAFHHGHIYEFEIAWEDSVVAELKHLLPDNLPETQLPTGDTVKIAPLNLLYALKMSHRYLKNSPHFLKTMRGIQHMRSVNATIDPDIMPWYKKREKDTYVYGHPNLNQRSKTFFDPNQGVTYKYDHDTIHLAMARDPLTPAYSKFKDDLAEVKVSKKKFFELDLETQLDSVMEESYVLALERSQIPFPGVLEPKKSFLIALEKVCTSIASGWWREFAWEHYDMAVERYSDSYIDKFRAGVDSGLIKPFNGEIRHMEK